MKIKFKKEIFEKDIVNETEIIDILLKNRQIKNIEEFINPTSPLKIKMTDFHLSFGKEIKKVIKILEKIKKNEETIVVYTDYDADGITGGAILWETLNLLGFKVMPYVPHRKHEGYGFSKIGIDNVKKLYNPSLIISVDHGITASEKVKYAKSLNIPVIITDHHLKPEKMPEEAEAIFHIPELSGSGVAYFFAKEIFEHFKKADSGVLEENFKSEYLAISSIGTIADMVPLIGPSRSLVKYGLEAFLKIKRPGIRHILKEAGIEGRKITPYEIGYIIAPRINAVGRLEHAIDALRLLCTQSEEKAHELACHLNKKNIERQDLVKDALAEAIKIVEKEYSSENLPKIITLTSDKWHEGIIGLIASKITEKYNRPAIIMTRVDGFLKGSARSIKSFHMTNFLKELKRYLIDVGGHKQASGFTIEENKLKAFIKSAHKNADKKITDADLKEVIEADIKIPVSKVNLKLAYILEKLQPFGIGNPQPTFYSQAEVIGARPFGKKKDHLRFYVKTNKISSFPLELIAFSSSELLPTLTRGKLIDVVYKLEIDRWGGSEKLRGIVKYGE